MHLSFLCFPFFFCPSFFCLQVTSDRVLAPCRCGVNKQPRGVHQAVLQQHRLMCYPPAGASYCMVVGVTQNRVRDRPSVEPGAASVYAVSPSPTLFVLGIPLIIIITSTISSNALVSLGCMYPGGAHACCFPPHHTVIGSDQPHCLRISFGGLPRL